MKQKIGWIIVAIGGAIGAVGSELITQLISNGGLPKKDEKREKKEVNE